MTNLKKSLQNEIKPFLDIIIPEQPIAMQRPRLGKGHTYNPQADEKVRLGWIFKEAMMKAHKSCTDKPLIVQMVFSFKRVKSNKRKHHTATPDIDNVIKFYLDCMQGDGGIVYFNDSAIVEVRASKGYTEKPSVHIVIYEV
jgi:Holliday junction resolvase RusA-like endonuclease